MKWKQYIVTIKEKQLNDIDDFALLVKRNNIKVAAIILATFIFGGSLNIICIIISVVKLSLSTIFENENISEL